ncbi:unnamed protein product [Mytilus coruscus]|uniref:Uncharacterized protein n=1 Tax=Mytilus coruscus TaxID=42192 RepID=A0A6J8A0L1_MYTCO|nr:unnamed protein product [Mytilus coruscus]
MTKHSEKKRSMIQNEISDINVAEYIKPKFTLYPELLIPDGSESRSEPSSRTCSFKDRTRHKSLIESEDLRRRNSLPISTENLLSVSYNDLRDAYKRPVKRVRSFKMTSKGHVNGHDLNKNSRRASINPSFIEKDLKRQRFPSDNSDDSAITCSCSSSCSSGYYRVLIIGANGVGKTTLAKRFMTSEYMSSFEIGNDDDDDKMLSVLVDDEESTMEFIDHSEHEEDLDRFPVDAYIVAFSVHDSDSFEVAKQYLQNIRYELYSDRAIILVANKVDLVRKRQISTEEARQIAKDYDCKYIETSAALNHKVDELLVGLLKQIKLKLNPEAIEKATANMIAQDQLEKPTSGKGPKKLLNKLFRKGSKTRSTCDNLFEL